MQVAASWVTVNVFPAIVNVPVRDEVVMFAATEYVAVPLPVPTLEVVIQDTLLDAVQVQPVPAVTVTLPLPPVAVAVAVVAEIENVQGAAS